MIFKEQPEGFDPKFDVVSCYVEHDGSILLLHRLPHKSQGGKWGVPAGKADQGESLEEAMLRELSEETGIRADRSSLQYLTRVFVKHPEHDIVYHMFKARFDECPAVTINPHEHAAHRWTAPREALQLNLVDDLDTCIEMFYK